MCELLGLTPDDAGGLDHHRYPRRRLLSVHGPVGTVRLPPDCVNTFVGVGVGYAQTSAAARTAASK